MTRPVVDHAGTSPRSGLLPRFIVFGLIVVLIVGALSVRLFYLQVDKSGYYGGLAESNRVELQAIPSTRGLIFDRQGRPLVRNVPTFSVMVRPADLPLTQRDQVVARLAALLGMSGADINETIDRNPGSSFDQVRVAVDVPQDVARVISEQHLELPGVEVTVEARRDYLTGPLFSQVLGYTGAVTSDDLQRLAAAGYLPNDTIGKAGVEASYEDVLRGVYGQEQVERDAVGREVSVLSQVKDPVAGDSLQLTLDTQLQQEALQALSWGMRAAGLKQGVFLVMNPQTGEVLAMVSLPTYDDNLFAQGISSKDFAALVKDTGQPLVNHAISEQYPPGSTYKLVAGSGALADRKMTDSTLIQTYPYIQLGSGRLNEWNHQGFGRLNIYTGFGHSSDTFFYQVAAMLGIDRLAYWASQYGFGAPTGIDLPAEASGIVPTNAWKQEVFGEPIYPGETMLAGIGQGYDAVTPLQLLNAYCALANGGKLYQPQVVRQVVGPDGQVVQAFQPKLIRKLPISQTVLKDMRVAARHVVTMRHTLNLVDMPLVVAGKSGTAEFGLPDSRGRISYHTWFLAFVPKNPAKTASDPDGYKAISRADSPLAVLAFAYKSDTIGNVAVEMVKYFLQIHFHLKHDYRLLGLLHRDSLYAN